MSKPVKRLIRKQVAQRLDGVAEVAVVSVVGIDGNTNNRLRGELSEKGIRVMVVKNSMARQAFEDLGIGAVAGLLDGPCAVAYGGESVVDVVREIMDRSKAIPELTVRGAFMDGELFGPDRVEELSKYPTRGEALSRIAGLGLATGGKVLGTLIGPGSLIAGILKTIEEKGEAGQEPAAAEAEAPAEAQPQPAAEAEQQADTEAPAGSEEPADEEKTGGDEE